LPETDAALLYNPCAMNDLDGERAQLEQELVRRLRAGDKAACAQCIELHAPDVYRLALRLTGHEADAEDVTQETFLNAFRAIDTFEWRAGLKTWLHRIAYNAAMQRLRRRPPPSVPVEAADDEEEAPLPRELFDWCCLPEADFESAEARAELEQAVRELPENLRLVFVLRELEELSTEETAAALGLTPQNVKVRLHRARLWLRERLAGYFTELAQRNDLAASPSA
jgi:RNA polymerase sigma-70 factor (ECF subfamily)